MCEMKWSSKREDVRAVCFVSDLLLVMEVPDTGASCRAVNCRDRDVYQFISSRKHPRRVCASCEGIDYSSSATFRLSSRTRVHNLYDHLSKSMFRVMVVTHQT